MSKPPKEKNMEDRIEVNGVKHVREDMRLGSRAVVVVDRGWIFAGDVTEENGRIYLDRAVWVFGWQSVGLNGALANPKSGKVDIRPLTTRVDIPAGAEIFRLPVANDWGL